ncbi:hypothetical protein [Natronococcus sp. A-GB7]|uniref:hypothetical protein n=1 Tax=Natronococcus sp. A-GB7 TaxID=3037649 RepID=UPI00241D42CB|nr:hypothetical protein [Natronococcus sp. A-GB7]MDG5820073.1 hypothetical protein [Natronococcus sp. A-GB7]
MHQPHAPSPSVPPGTDRSLASAFASCVLTVVAFSAALVAATTTAAVVTGPPLVTASVALAVGFATVVAVPVGASIGGRWLLERYRRRGRRPATDDLNHPDPRPKAR